MKKSFGSDAFWLVWHFLQTAVERVERLLREPRSVKV